MHLYRIRERRGCTYDDGSDNIKHTSRLEMHNAETQEQIDAIGEEHAEMYGSCDYSYRFHAEKVAELNAHEVRELTLILTGKLGFSLDLPEVPQGHVRRPANAIWNAETQEQIDRVFTRERHGGQR